MLTQIRRVGWFVVELALLVVILCVLLNLILGADSGGFISSVAANAANFLQRIPSGTFLGLVMILVLVWVFRQRSS
ncbi:MAG TPA: hypothetical protein VMQ11_01850 [Alphaproteobacteria bacterium]|nr:hypothetical protein [Alphaproteobacteria bacterium]